MSLQVRRTIVWVLAAILGIAGGLGIVLGLFQTSLEKYYMLNFILLVVAIGTLFWIWLDYFFSTDMLPK